MKEGPGNFNKVASDLYRDLSIEEMEILNEVEEEEEEGDKEPELMSVRDIKKEGAKVFKKNSISG